MLRKKIAKIDERLPACEDGREEDEMGGSLQNNSITDTVSAGNKGLLFWVLIKVLSRRPKGKYCARKLEPNHSWASKDCHYLTQIHTEAPWSSVML